MVDEALNILDASSADRDEVALAKARAEFRLKVAGKHNRPAYGEDKQVTAVQVNFGSLALDAMRTPVAAAQASPANVSPATRAIITGDAPAMLAAGSVTTASIAPDVEHVSDADA